MSEYRPLSRTASCSDGSSRATVDVLTGAVHTTVEAVVDLDTTDGTPAPRIQVNDGVWIDVNDAFVTAFRALAEPSASSGAQSRTCGEALPPPPRHTVRLTGVVDMTGGVDIVRPGRTHPLWASGFYNSDTFFNPNGELILEIKPVEQFTLTLDAGAGPNFNALQPNGLQHGYYFDFPQVFAEWCPNLLCLGAGRRGDRSGAETYRSDLRDFTLASVNYSISPFTQLVWGELGLVGSNAAFRFAVGPGPDQFINNNGMPYLMSNFSLTYPNFALSADYQGGADQPGNNDHWRHFVDLGLTFGSTDGPVRATVYGMFGTETTESGEQRWGGANAYLRIRPTGSPVAINLRGGYTHDDGIRTGVTGLDAVQFDAGLNVYALESLQFRVQGGVIGAIGTRPFDGDSLLPRMMFQVVWADSVGLGGGPGAVYR
ncbi:MAG TPA: hypothetical protein VLJ37_03610 [bacterium]|nr:hypothetical protein [bacterium]